MPSYFLLSTYNLKLNMGDIELLHSHLIRNRYSNPGLLCVLVHYVLKNMTTQYSFRVALQAHTNICANCRALAGPQLTVNYVVLDVLKHSV
jgi:hypothetical protein